MGWIGDFFLGKRSSSYFDMSIEELNEKKQYYQEKLDNIRNQINPKALPKIEKYTVQQVEKYISILKNQLAKSKIVSKEKLTTPTIDDLNRALEILRLKEQIEMLDRQIKELQKEKAA